MADNQNETYAGKLRVDKRYINRIIYESDCTAEYARIIGRTPKFPCVRVRTEGHCNGTREITTTNWLLPDWERAKKQGFYMVSRAR